MFQHRLCQQIASGMKIVTLCTNSMQSHVHVGWIAFKSGKKLSTIMHFHDHAHAVLDKNAWWL